MNTFLSIDIDFFYDRKLFSLLNWLWEHYPHAKWSAVCNHQQMLRHVNVSGCQELLNFDHHSDLHDVYGADLAFSCANWISFVQWREKGEYCWVRPTRSFHYDCNDNPRHNGYPMFNRKYYHQSPSDWNRYHSIYLSNSAPLSKFVELLESRTITHISLCQSPGYSYDELQRAFRIWCKARGLRISLEHPLGDDSWGCKPFRVKGKFRTHAWDRDRDGYLHFQPKTKDELYYMKRECVFRKMTEFSHSVTPSR